MSNTPTGEHKIVIDERRTQPTLFLGVGKRKYGLDSLKGVLLLGGVITMVLGAFQALFKVLDLKVGRGVDARIEALDRRTSHEDSLSRIERTFLLQQNIRTHDQIENLTLVVCAAVSDKSTRLVQTKCDEALRSATGKP